MATALPTNAASFSLGEVVDATHGTLVHGNPSTHLEGVSTDTRAIAPGALFVALVGERHDAHHHLAAAIAAKAGALVVQRGRGRNLGAIPVVEVDDTLAALGALASAHAARIRALRPIPVVAVSGAVGKTSTKELLATAMTAAFGPTLATPGNLNNLVGAPLTLLGLTAAHRAAVIECGSNAPGEIARIAAMIAPDVALCTNADAAHTALLGSIQAVAEEEGAVFGYARRAVVGNVDEPLSRAQMLRAPEGVAWWLFGEAAEANLQVRSRKLRPDGRSDVLLSLDTTRCRGRATMTVRTHLLGASAAINLCAAVTTLLAAGADPATLSVVGEALGNVAAVPGRLNPREVDGALWIDDTYNASPRAVRAALATARELADLRGGRLVVALGDMLELGELSAECHESAGRGVAAARASVLLAVGPEMARAADVARAAGVETVMALPDAEAARERLAGLVGAGDVVLVKGSRGVKMERCLPAVEGAGR